MDELIPVAQLQGEDEDGRRAPRGDERPAAARPGADRLHGQRRVRRPEPRRLAAHPDVDLVGVVTAPPPAGRPRHGRPTPIAGAASVELRSGHPDAARLRDEARSPHVLALEPDLLVLADYGQIVPAALLDLAHGALNLHPSLLPRHRGAAPIPAAILAGDARPASR